MQKHYKILGVDKNSSKADILIAYENMIKSQPDKRFEIQTAYRILTSVSGAHMQSLYDQMSAQSKEVAEEVQDLMDQEKNKQAISLLNKSIKIEKNTTYLMYLLAKAHASKGTLPTALNTINKIYKQYPENIFFMELYLVYLNISGKDPQKVLELSKAGYIIDKNSFVFLSIICEQLEEADLHKEALEFLIQAEDNAFMSLHLWWIYLHCAAICIQIDNIQNTLKYIEKLSLINLDDEPLKFQVGNTILNMTEELASRKLMEEAAFCLTCAIKILPDNDQSKAKIVIMQRLLDSLKLLDKVEKDNKVPHGIISFIAGELMPLDNLIEDAKQIEAYKFMSEFHFLQEFSGYMVGIKYLENNYPELYNVKKKFFDSIRDSKKRKELQSYYLKNVSKHEQIVEDLMDEWEELYEEYYDDQDDDENENLEPPTPIKPLKLGKVIPFRKREE